MVDSEGKHAASLTRQRGDVDMSTPGSLKLFSLSLKIMRLIHPAFLLTM